MGLSNEERFSKIAYSISNILKQAEHLKDEYSFGKLKSLTNELWPAFLGKSANKSFWIFGGGFSVGHFNGLSLLELAFEENKPAVKDTTDDSEDEEYNDSRRCRETVSSMLEISTLANDPERAAIVEIHQWLENLVYALCRYDDDFAQNLWPLNKIVRQMQGEVFEIIREDSSFYRVWLLKNIVDKCVNIWSDDFLSKWVCKQNIHHDLRLMDEHKLEDLQAVYFDLQPKYTKDIPLETRLFIVLALCGRRYHYDHQFNALKKMAEEHNNQSEEKINLDKLQEIFDWCKEQKKVYDERQTCRQFCNLSGQEV